MSATEPPSPDLAPPANSEQHHLDRVFLRSIAWSGGAKWATQILSWASTFMVARILTPADYGLVGMATSYLGLVALVNEFGIAGAIVAHRSLTKHQISEINSLSLLFGLAGFAVSCAMAGPLAVFFASPALSTVVLVMSSSFIITAFRVVPLALMRRDLDFRSLAFNDALQAMVLAISVVTFAVLGFGYWTLAIGSLLSAFLSTGAAIVRRPHGFALPRSSSIAEAIRFGRDLVVQRVAWYVYSNADFFVIGRVLGQAALGAYSFAWSLASIPVEKVSALVGTITPSLFAAVNQDRAQLRRYLLLLTEGLALVTLPATLGLALVSRDFIGVALGAKWQGAIVPLQILAAYTSVRSVTTLLTTLANMTGHSKTAMWNAVLSAVVMPVAFIIGSRWGTAGVASAWLVAYPFVAVPLYRIVFGIVELSVRDYWRALWPPVQGTAVMVAAVLLVRWLAPAQWPAAARLSAMIATGVLAYTTMIFTLHRERVVRAFETIRGRRERTA